MDQRVEFVSAYLREQAPVSALCATFGISRRTGYKWIARYREAGWPGLADRSRAPHDHGRRMAPELAEAIIALRRARPYWGPRKLRAVLQRRAPERAWPAPSTIGDLLRRHGLVVSRRRRPVLPDAPAPAPFAAIEQPNDLWCIDFKGWFRTRDGTRCDPLTVTDAYSRYLLVCTIVPIAHEPVEAAMAQAFKAYGLPRAIRSDNGPPFASTGVGGLTRLSLAWLKAGIALERIEPGKPQQNGRHERFHRTLKRETSMPPAASPAAQQRRFDDFRRDYNHNRPHEALAQTPPGAHWRPSPRRYPDPLPQPCYDAAHMVRKVRGSGEIKLDGRSVFISETLAGETVGLLPTRDGQWMVRYAHIDLGIVDAQRNRLVRFPPAANRGRTQANQTETLLPM